MFLLVVLCQLNIEMKPFPFLSLSLSDSCKLLFVCLFLKNFLAALCTLAKSLTFLVSASFFLVQEAKVNNMKAEEEKRNNISFHAKLFKKIHFV